MEQDIEAQTPEHFKDKDSHDGDVYSEISGDD